MLIIVMALAVLLMAGPAQAQASTPTDKPFSGQYESYEDTVNGYKLSLPVEFQLHTKGTSTDWGGPTVDGAATGAFVNVNTFDKFTHPQVLYEAIIRSKKADPTVIEVTPVKYKLKMLGKPVYGFRCREALVKPGTRDPKEPGEIYRWYLFVWGNQRAYELMISSSVATMQKGDVMQPVVNHMISSFTPIGVR